jgi:hypothetical protein
LRHLLNLSNVGQGALRHDLTEPTPMPRDCAVTLEDLVQRGLDRITVSCASCGRAGSYKLVRALDRWGLDAKLPDILADLTRDCGKTPSAAILDRCEARFEGLV